MKIQVNPGDVTTSEAIDAHIRHEVEHALNHMDGRVTRVEVHLHEENGPKAGIDKRCVMEARPAGQPPIAVDERSDDMYKAIGLAATKLGRALKHRFDRLDTRKASA